LRGRNREHMMTSQAKMNLWLKLLAPGGSTIWRTLCSRKRSSLPGRSARRSRRAVDGKPRVPDATGSKRGVVLLCSSRMRRSHESS
jgi:hypothetical protein